MTTVPLRLLQELSWAMKGVERSYKRGEAIGREQRIRERFNQIAYPDDGEIEPAFFVPSKYKYAPLAEVKLLPVESNSQIVGWIASSSASLGNGGFSYGFLTQRIFPTKEKAIHCGVGSVIRYALAELRRSDTPKSALPHVNRVIAECRKVLSPQRQSTLF